MFHDRDEKFFSVGVRWRRKAFNWKVSLSEEKKVTRPILSSYFVEKPILFGSNKKCLFFKIKGGKCDLLCVISAIPPENRTWPEFRSAVRCILILPSKKKFPFVNDVKKTKPKTQEDEQHHNFFSITFSVKNLCELKINKQLMPKEKRFLQSEIKYWVCQRRQKSYNLSQWIRKCSLRWKRNLRARMKRWHT